MHREHMRTTLIIAAAVALAACEDEPGVAGAGLDPDAGDASTPDARPDDASSSADLGVGVQDGQASEDAAGDVSPPRDAAAGDACLFPSAEVCNGRDDDCDGATDEETDPGTPCGLGTGACETGVFVCLEGEIACEGGSGPADEICNGVDDDCDGDADEEAAEAGAACEVEGVCGSGTTRCQDGAVVCDPPAAPPRSSATGATTTATARPTKRPRTPVVRAAKTPAPAKRAC